MKLTSDDGKAEVEIVRNDDADPYSGYWIGLKIQTVDGEYSGANGCVHFSEFNRFLTHFSEFIRTRQGDVTLTMTEDCRLDFFRWNNKADVGVRATIAKLTMGHESMRMTPAMITGTFKLASEFMNTIEHDFMRMKENEPPAAVPGRDGAGLMR